jgi:8-oxo-dGTP pyrophosphatase MutT (NUDIX family)
MKDKIIDWLTGPLPGRDAHSQIWSYPRNTVEEGLAMVPPPRQSAVLMLLRQRADLELLYIVRSDFGIHGGQVAFPGGKLDTHETHVECAMRETEEELGIPRHQYEMMGTLSPVFIPPSHMIVYPQLAWVEKDIQLKPNQEIADVFWVPISEVMPQCIIEKEHYLKAFDRTQKIKGIPVQSYFLWGASAMITQELTVGLSNLFSPFERKKS